MKNKKYLKPVPLPSLGFMGFPFAIPVPKSCLKPQEAELAIAGSAITSLEIRESDWQHEKPLAVSATKSATHETKKGT